jgi:hypothetical protein
VLSGSSNQWSNEILRKLGKSGHPAATQTPFEICSENRGKFCLVFSTILEGLQRSTIFRHSGASRKVHFASEIESIHPNSNDLLLFPDPVWGSKLTEIGT